MNTKEDFYEVLVSNHGIVYRGYIYEKAFGFYTSYVDYSQRGVGAFAGESVELWKNGTPVERHLGVWQNSVWPGKVGDTRYPKPKKPKSKLFRNLKPGDKFKVETGYGIEPHKEAIITVSKVEEARTHSRIRQWAVYGSGYPFWFPGPVMAEHDERTELVLEE
jgi:hypothetical protein